VITTRTNGFAVWSLVSSIVGGVLGMVCCLPAPIGGIIAIVLGRQARGQIRSSGGAETGEGLAQAGEIIGWVITGLSILAILGIVGLIMLGNQTRNVFSNISAGLGGP
jgi:hypothetical protein